MLMVAGIVGFVAGGGAVLLALAALRSRPIATNAEAQTTRVGATSPANGAEEEWKRVRAKEFWLQEEFDRALLRHREQMARVREEELRLRGAVFGGPS